MRIGNILSDTELKVDENFNVVNSFDDLIQGIPTLIVGIDNAKKVKEDLNYIDRNIDDDTFWTFKKSEKRMLFEEDLFYFIENSYRELSKNIKYKFVDVILNTEDNLKSIFKNISNHDNNITFIYHDMIYVYSDDIIYGFDLRQVKFCGRDVDKFILKIKQWSKVLLQDEKILIEYKNNLDMFEDNSMKYVPLLYSIKHNE